MTPAVAPDLAPPRTPAAELLAAAQASAYRWPPTFAGFVARLTVRHPGGTLTGTVRIGPTLRCDLAFDQPEIQVGETERWCREQLASLVAHRRHMTFENGDGQYRITYGDTSPHVLGPQLAVGDRFDSTYRVLDGQITEIVRHMPDESVHVHVLERVPAPDGRLLPRRVLSVFAHLSGRITRIQSIDETWTEVGGVALPRRRSVLTQDCLDTEVRVLQFTELRPADQG